MKGNKIPRFVIGDIKKFDMSTIASEIVNVVDRYDSETMHLTEMLSALKAYQPKLETLKRDRPKLPEVVETSVLRKALHLEFRELKIRLVKLETKHSSLTKAEILRISLFLRNQTVKLLDESSDGLKDRAEKLIQEVNNDASIKALLTKAGMDDCITRISNLQSEYGEALINKTLAKSALPKSQTLEIKTKAIRLIHNIFTTIEIFRDQYTNIDYQPLIQELSTVVITRRSVKKAAITRAQNQQLASLQSGENETTVESSAKTPSTVV